MSILSAAKTYKQNDVLSSDKLRLIVMVYDYALKGCQERDLEKTWRALKLLIEGLNLDADPLGSRLLAIYEYCNRLANSGKFDEAYKLLKELRDAWDQARKK